MKRQTYLIAILLLVGLAACQDPAKSRVYMDEGNKLMMNYGKFDEAVVAFDQAVKYDKNNYEAYYLRGCAKTNAQHYEEALADFEKAIELKPDYADAYFNLGRTYFLLNNEDKACEYYQLAAKYGRPNLDDYLKRCN